MLIVDGRAITDKLIRRLAQDFKKLKKKGILAKAAVLCFAKNPATISYLKQKEKVFGRVGAILDIYEISSKYSEKKVLQLIGKLNKDKNVHGIMLEMPIAKKYDYCALTSAIALSKDIDGMNPLNLGKIMCGPREEFLLPSTAKGVILLLDYWKIPVKGKSVVIVGHSLIVGRPLSVMLLARNATVTTCHIYTKNLSSFTRNADILISATGKPGLIKGNMVKKGVIAIDIGYGKVNGKFCGDFEFDSVKKRATLITPVPGGSGPFTALALLTNLLNSISNLFIVNR